MYLYKGKSYGVFKDLKAEYDFLCASELMALCNCNINRLTEILKEKKVVPEIVKLSPSGKIYKMYKRQDVAGVFNIAKASYKDEEIPKNYLDKKSFCEKLGIKSATLNSICYWCTDFNKHSKFFYVRNVKKRYYLVNEEALLFYKDKLNKYYNPDREANKKKLEEINTNMLYALMTETKDYKHHKIKIDTKTLSKILNTTNKYYQKLVEIYKHYEKETVYDVSTMELHHIVPRFYGKENYYPELNNMTNLIYLPPNIHFLVHFLEYKCAKDIYKDKFLSACCVKTATIKAEQIKESYMTDIIELLLKAFL